MGHDGNNHITKKNALKIEIEIKYEIHRSDISLFQRVDTSWNISISFLSFQMDTHVETVKSKANVCNKRLNLKKNTIAQLHIPDSFVTLAFAHHHKNMFFLISRSVFHWIEVFCHWFSQKFLFTLCTASFSENKFVDVRFSPHLNRHLNRFSISWKS